MSRLTTPAIVSPSDNASHVAPAAPAPIPAPSIWTRIEDGILATTVKRAASITGWVVLAAVLIGGGLYFAGYEIKQHPPTPVPANAPPDTPPLPPAGPPPAPPTPPPPPKLEIHGPQPRLVIAEVSSVFAVKATDGGEPEWHVVPPNVASVNPTHGHLVDVTAHDQGKFSIFVSVAGDNRMLATAQVEVEAMAQVIQQPMPPVPPPMPDPVPAPPPAPPQPIAKSVAEVIAAQLAQVNSPNRAVEAHTIAGCINTVVGRINAGFISPGADVANEVTDAVQAALGPKAAAWDLFLGSISIVLDTFRNQGQITTAATTVPALSEIAGVLLKAQ